MITVRLPNLLQPAELLEKSSISLRRLVRTTSNDQSMFPPWGSRAIESPEETNVVARPSSPVVCEPDSRIVAVRAARHNPVLALRYE
ncbi:MAG: hypothetical protein IIB57_11155 [Planctomycetes bacterium]|nr:hypothetical protein [Planctomycetota bacterium]